jgi:major membrane immunogen (membrane-anchored lipoprotein)
MKLSRLLLACVFCAAIALSACGGSDSDGDATASAEVPPEIGKAVNDGLTRDEYSAEGARVVQAEIDGDEATAEVELTGGTLDGQTVEATLSRDKKGWKLKKFEEFIDLDETQLRKKYKEVTESLPEKLGPPIVDCLTENFSEFSQDKVEAMYLDREEALFRELGQSCASN